LNVKLDSGSYTGFWANSPGDRSYQVTIKFIDKVGNNYRYIAWKSWDNNWNNIVTPDACSIQDPWSRPLFGSVDYPANNELATYTMLSGLLLNDPPRGLSFTETAARTISKTYAPRKIITRFARFCSNADGTNPSYDFNTI
jgi:hypothetical protein